MAPKAPRAQRGQNCPHTLLVMGRRRKETSLMVISIFLQQMLSVQQRQSKHTFILQQWCWVMRPPAGFSCCHQVQRSSEATAAGWECSVLQTTSAPTESHSTALDAWAARDNGCKGHPSYVSGRKCSAVTKAAAPRWKTK